MRKRPSIRCSVLMFGFGLALGLLPSHALAGEKALTEAQIHEHESRTKDFVIDLIAARVWTKDCDEYRQFMRYAPMGMVLVSHYDADKKAFGERGYVVSGALYRRAFVLGRALASGKKLDKEGQERINLDIFGQPQAPARILDADIKIRERIGKIAAIIAGEASARPADATIIDKIAKESPFFDRMPPIVMSGPVITAAEKMHRTESATKDFVIDLLDAGIWTRDHNEYKTFMRYKADTSVRVALYDEQKKAYTDKCREVTGAQYRHAFVLARAYTKYANLDQHTKQRISLEIYGQAAPPESGSQAHLNGRAKIREMARIIAGEAHARQVQADKAPPADTPPPKSK